MDVVMAVLGIFTSLAFGLVPQLKAWFDAGDGARRSAVMLAFSLLAGLVVVLSSCVFHLTFVECTSNGVQLFIQSFVAFLVANQTTFLMAEPLYKKNV